MKYLTIALLTALLSFSSFTTYAEEKKQPETKKVCIDEKQKNGNVKQICKTIKVHKKLDGKPVPGQTK
jgi:hypothetical protein